MSKGLKETKKVRTAAVRSNTMNGAATAGPEPPPRKADPAPIVALAPKAGSVESIGFRLTPATLQPTLGSSFQTAPPTAPAGLATRGISKYPWKMGIVTTTFWIGEDAAPNNPVPNQASSWDPAWSKNYGGVDTPDRTKRAGYLPASFVPGQNPFYIALPYNDVTMKGHKPEASTMIPWFKEAYQGEGRTVLKGRWLAIHFKGRVAYAQWEDCGPFRTDHAAYVFGNERPKPNLNRGAGLDVSPAVRDYLGMADTDVTDWRFVDFEEVPHGPWSTHGENNTFVMKDRAKAQPVVLMGTIQPTVR